MKILLVQQLSWGLRVGHAIARVLHARGHALAAVVHGLETRRFLAAQREVPYTRIDFADPLYDRGEEPVSAGEVAALERRHGLDSLWRVVAADRVLLYSFRDSRHFRYRTPKSNAYLLSVCAATARAAREIVEAVRPDYALAPVIASVMNYFLYLECRRAGIPFYTIGYARHARHYFIADDERVTSTALREAHARLLEAPGPWEHAARAREIYAELRAGAVRPYQPADVRPRPRPGRWGERARATALLPARLVRAAVRARRVTDIHNIWLPHNSRVNAVASQLVAYRELFRRTDAQGACHRDLGRLEADYVYYPLQVEPELALMVPAPQFANQLELCRRIALGLPGGVRLLVKEHPSMVSSRRAAYYDKLRGLANVELIHSAVPSHAIYTDPRCRAVVVLTSTVGFEAAMNGRPVVLLAPTEYEGLPTVRRVATIEAALAALAPLCQGPRPAPGPGIDRGNLAYLCAMLAHSVEADYPEAWIEGAGGLRAEAIVDLVERRLVERTAVER